MSELDLVFDFNGWTLNGVYIFSEPAAFAFLGTEKTPPVEIVVQPGLLERMKAGLRSQKVQAKRKFYDDYALIYSKLGLWFDYDGNQIYHFEICLTNSSKFTNCFSGRFIFGDNQIELNSNSSLQDVKDNVGNPNEENIEFGYITYKNDYYELSFLFNEHQKLEGIEGSILDNVDNEAT
jgi:hypothetical protein